MAEDTQRDRTYTTLAIICGNMTSKFSIVQNMIENKEHSPSKEQQDSSVSHNVMVDGTSCKFNIKKLETNDQSMEEKFQMTDAVIILYDMSRPETVAIYDSFIKNVIGTPNKAVRVIGILPSTRNTSVNRKSMRTKKIAAKWGESHKIVVDRRDNKLEIKAILRNIAAELLGIKHVEQHKGHCAIL